MSSKKRLHIVSFDNPFPPNYGGVIDVFYKLKALHDQGIEIVLHAFEYGRKPTTQLNKFCKKVYYYQRRNFVNPFVGSLPYIVNTRNSPELLDNLLKDDAPVLFEGLHTCFFLDHPLLAKRTKFVRMHNIEHEYYEKLESVERNFFKKYFFTKEATRLREFEKILSHAQGILAHIIARTHCVFQGIFQFRFCHRFYPSFASSRALANRGSQSLPTNQVQVQVKNDLPGMRAGIDYHAVAALADTLLLSQPLRNR